MLSSTIVAWTAADDQGRTASSSGQRRSGTARQRRHDAWQTRGPPRQDGPVLTLKEDGPGPRFGAAAHGPERQAAPVARIPHRGRVSPDRVAAAAGVRGADRASGPPTDVEDLIEGLFSPLSDDARARLQGLADQAKLRDLLVFGEGNDPGPGFVAPLAQALSGPAGGRRRGVGLALDRLAADRLFSAGHNGQAGEAPWPGMERLAWMCRRGTDP